MNWRDRVRVKHLFTDDEDHETVQATMTAVADVLVAARCFRGFRDLPKFRAIPQGDDVFGPIYYANRLLDAMYNYADDNRIWIE
jgi:hypothetical protein